MPLQLMYITNNPEIACIAEKSGVDRIFVDLETVGKQARQGGMDTVQSHHTLEDIKNIRKVIKQAKLLVRSNPIYENSDSEIEEIIKNGADIIMLPFFKSKEEVEKFVKLVNGRAKTMLLFETPESVDKVDEILSVDGIDEVHIGLNDMHLGYKLKFMFQILTNGTAEYLIDKFKEKNIPYGFGGIARLGQGAIPAEYVISEHYRLCSSFAILGRSFCNVDKMNSVEEIEALFIPEMKKIRDYETEAGIFSSEKHEENRKFICDKVEEIVKGK